MAEPRFYTYAEAAQLLTLSERTVSRLVAADRLVATGRGLGRRITAKSLNALLDELESGGGAQRHAIGILKRVAVNLADVPNHCIARRPFKPFTANRTKCCHRLPSCGLRRAIVEYSCSHKLLPLFQCAPLGQRIGQRRNILVTCAQGMGRAALVEIDL